MATYNFGAFQGVDLVDPTIRDYEITVLKDSPTTLKVKVVVRFEQLTGTNGYPEVTLYDVPVLNLNGDEGNMEPRIWDYLNDYSNGYIQV